MSSTAFIVQPRASVVRSRTMGAAQKSSPDSRGFDPV